MTQRLHRLLPYERPPDLHPRPLAPEAAVGLKPSKQLQSSIKAGCSCSPSLSQKTCLIPVKASQVAG